MTLRNYIIIAALGSVLAVLNKEVQAYLGMNRYKEAAEIREICYFIKGTLLLII